MTTEKIIISDDHYWLIDGHKIWAETLHDALALLPIMEDLERLTWG